MNDVTELWNATRRVREGYEFGNPLRNLVGTSPDGASIVFAANRQLYLRALNEYDARRIAGTESPLGPSNPVFSPDGRSIAFYSSGAVRRIAISATAVFVCQADPPYGLSWSENGIRVGQGTKGIIRLNPNGGKPEVIVPAKPGEVLLAGEVAQSPVSAVHRGVGERPQSLEHRPH